MATNNSILYLLEYSNYFNRIVKKLDTLSEYIPFVSYDPIVCNFNPADGVDTYHDINVPYVANTPAADYVVVTDEQGNILSRWYIVGANRNRGGQYRINLHRDLIADYYDAVISTPAFIEKGTVLTSNKLIFNKEGGIKYNEIKKKEELLKDEVGCGWLIGYIARNHGDVSINVSSSSQQYSTAPVSLADIEALGPNPYSLFDGSITNYPLINFRGTKTSTTTAAKGWNISFFANGTLNAKTEETGKYYSRYFTVGDINTAASALSTGVAQYTTQWKTLAGDFIKSKIGANSFISQDTLTKLKAMNGGTWVSDGKTFRFEIHNTNVSSQAYDVTANAGGLYDTMNNVWTAAGVGSSEASSTNPPSFRVYGEVDYYSFTVQEIAPVANLSITETVNGLQDAPYKMFAIPYGPISVTTAANASFTTDKNVSIRVASELATTLGGLGTGTSKLYDLQLLPYLPMRQVITGNGKISIVGLRSDVDYSLVSVGENTNKSIVLWPTFSNFSFSISKTIAVPDNNIEFKIDNETKFVRLCSPNYSGSFDFQPTANYGVSAFEVNCSYKPYQPYLHINPLWTDIGLYGGDFNDQRGLVCSGDFSIPVINDSWEQYQIQNKSYEDAHKRQVENLNTNYEINRKQTITAGRIGAITGMVSGATTGGMVGSLGGPVGGAIGAVAGAAAGAASFAGLSADLKAMEELHKEAVSFADDMYGYNLQNIKALPYSLGKVGAFTINNKIFPFLEFYEATQEEVDALRFKLTYNGFTIMSGGFIKDYLQYDKTFIQAQLVRLETICEDYHTAVAIANEIHKGVYI